MLKCLYSIEHIFVKLSWPIFEQLLNSSFTNKTNLNSVSFGKAIKANLKDL